MPATDRRIFLGVSDQEELMLAEALGARTAAGKSTIQRETTVACNREKWKRWIEAQFLDIALVVERHASCGVVLMHDNGGFIQYSVSSSTTEVRVSGDVDWCDGIIRLVEDAFPIVTSYVEWVYRADGSSARVPLNRDRLPVSEMFPFIHGETLEQYYDSFMESSANILLLIGPPGTGKTSFIRGLLAHRECSAIVSYDATILEKDAFFARFIEDDVDVMVLEDSDNFLKSRSDGNDMMHRFLNVGDGLVTTRGKKMIFSTNLPSIRDVDPALIRPGRCFDILTFDNLNAVQAASLAARIGVDAPEAGKDSFSIAEVFNKQSKNVTVSGAVRRPFGFA